MPIVTPGLLQQVKDIIRKYHTAFIINAFGPDTFPAAVVDSLKASGLIHKEQEAAADDAYIYGQAVAQLEDPKIPEWTADQVKAHVRKQPIPRTQAEKEAAKTARLSAAIYCQGLGNTVEKDTGQILIEADAALREKLRGKIQDAVATNIEARETVKKLKTDLGHATQDWTRDLDRIAITEKQNAMQAGVADGIRKKYGDGARCAILHPADMCPDCRRLTVGPDGQPRIFKLSQLPGPGANVKKKKAAWVPCLGAIHPHCQGSLVAVPENWGFNEEGDLVPGGKFGVEVPEEEEEAEKSFRNEAEHADILEKARKLAGKIEFQGLPISLEHLAGDSREWKDRNGNSGKTLMRHAYGYVRGSLGTDQDHHDVYVGLDPNATHAYIIHQRKKLGDGKFGGFDEQKTMLGFPHAEAAKAAYLAQYNDPGFFGGMTAMPMAEFRAKVLDKENHGKKLTGTKVDFPESTQFTIPDESLSKAGPFIGPNGGKWADAAHTISWHEDFHGLTARHHKLIQRAQAQKHVVVRSGKRHGKPFGTQDRAAAQELMARGILEHVTTSVAHGPQRNAAGGPSSAAQRSPEVESVYRLTQKHQAEMAKAGPLLNPEHGGPIPTVVGAETLDADRGPVTGGGFALQAPAEPGKHGRPFAVQDHVGAREFLLSGQPRTAVIRMDPRVYEFDADTIDYVQPINMDEGVMATTHDSLQPVERDLVERQLLQVASVPRNTVNPGWDWSSGKYPDANVQEPVQQFHIEDDTVEKAAGPFTGPRGGKWADAQHTVPWHTDTVAGRNSALHELGVGEADLPSNAHLGKLAVEAVALVKRAGFKVPHRIVNSKFESRAIAYGSPVNGIGLTRGRVSEADLQAQHDSGFLSSANPVLHEIGHIVHAGHAADSYDHLSTWMSAHTAKPVAAKVSKYAASNPKEFVAEVFAGHLSGKRYPEDVMALYHQQHGPPLALEKADHKYTHKEGYTGHWVYTYAEKLGGKVVPHATDSGMSMVKIPLEHKSALENLKNSHGLSGNISEGGKYAMLPVAHAELAKISPPKPKAISPQLHIGTSSNPVPMPGPAPMHDIPEMLPSSIPANPKAGWMTQAGQAVLLGGHPAHVAGWDFQGNPVAVTKEGTRLTGTWGSVTNVGAKAPPQNPAHKLPAGTVRKPTQLQREAVQEVLGAAIPAAGGKSAMDYANWLGARGHDVYLVGGIVRDMLAMTTPGKESSKADILKAMNDVDFVTSAPPTALAAVQAALAQPGVVKAAFPDVQQKGILPSSLTVDLASMASGGVYDHPAKQSNGQTCRPATFDHDLAKDAGRRDFTANALYYDVHNHAIVDPTGHGVSDARNKVLRMLPGDEWSKNDRLAVRFWKFRARGWTGDPETTKFMVKRASQELSAFDLAGRAKFVGAQIAKEGFPEKNLETFRKKMYEDGAGHVYEKYLKPVEASILAVAQAHQKKKHG